jgi:outer membrane lipoprotein-sorting protein
MKKLFLFFIVLVSFSALSAQSAKGIVEQYLENIGGAEQWQNLKTMKTTAEMSMQGMSFKGVIYAKYPDRQRVEVDINGMKLIQAYDGETAWWINPMMGSSEPQKMPEAMAQSMSNQEFESPFINYQEKGHTVELLGEKELEGTATYEVRLGRADGRTELYYFDKEALVPIKMSTKSGDGQTIETLFSDYRKMDGGLVSPYTMEVKIGGSTQQVINFNEIALNEELKDDFFAYPEK